MHIKYPLAADRGFGAGSGVVPSSKTGTCCSTISAKSASRLWPLPWHRQPRLHCWYVTVTWNVSTNACYVHFHIVTFWGPVCPSGSPLCAMHPSATSLPLSCACSTWLEGACFIAVQLCPVPVNRSAAVSCCRKYGTIATDMQAALCLRSGQRSFLRNKIDGA